MPNNFSKSEFFAYLAGMIDADGCILLAKHKDRKAKRQFSWRPLIKVTNSNRSVLELFKNEFGGNICNGQIPKLGKKKVYQWSIGSTVIRNIIDEIIQFMVIKKDRAKLIRRAVEITVDHRTREYNLDKIDYEMEKIHLRIKELNH